jgi:glycerol-3-phosphate acyltransferase PlsY
MLLFWAILCYLLGSIPFGLLIAKIWKIDIRRHGSGNIGATNVLRTLGPLPGAVVLLLDFLKGWLAIFLGGLAGGTPSQLIILGSAVILGHMFSVFLRFKGGKGVATSLGVLAGLTPDIFLISALLAALILFTTRYVSAASLTTSLCVPFLMLLTGKPLPYTLLAALAALFIFIRHVPNLKRLLQGTELRLGEKR